MTSAELRRMLGREWEVSEIAGRWLTVWAPRRMATVDLRDRCWRFGGQVTHGESVNGLKYTGRSWKQRMVADIVAWIDSDGAITVSPR